MFHINCPDVLITKKCPFKCDYCFEEQANQDIDEEVFKKYIEEACFLGFFPFGGEPLLKIDLLIRILDNLEDYQKRLVTNNVITNGILIPKHVEKIKNNNIGLQISIDGPKHVHDKHRKYPDGRGTWEDVIKGIESCIENDIKWSLHGVCTRDNLQHFAESMLWFFNMYKIISIERAIEEMNRNTIQIIFEEDYTDKDIDILIEQFYLVCKGFEQDEDLTDMQKKEAIHQFLTRKGGACGVGTSFMALDENLNIYPCHRLTTVPEKDKYTLGNVYKPKEFKNFNLYNSMYISKSFVGLYSSHTDLKMGYQNGWFMWCPATNLQTSDNLYYQSAKYNVVFTEIGRAIEDLKKIYNIENGISRKQCNCE